MNAHTIISLPCDLRMEMRMIRWMCDVSMKEIHPITELRRRLGVEAIGDVMRRCRLMWLGHVERKGNADCVKVGGEGDRFCRQAEEDLAKHCLLTYIC